MVDMSNAITQSAESFTANPHAVTRERRYACRDDGAAVTLDVARANGDVCLVSWNVNRGNGWRAKGWHAYRPSEAAALAFVSDEKWPQLLAWLEALPACESTDGAARAFSAQVASMSR